MEETDVTHSSKTSSMSVGRTQTSDKNNDL